MWTKRSSYTVGTIWKRIWRFLKKLKVKLSYDLAVILLGIYSNKMKSLCYTCTLMEFAYIKAKIQNQSNCSPQMNG